MIHSFERRSRLRKLGYALLIVALFSATLVMRRYFLDVRAAGLDLSEQKLGETELTGSVVRLTLTGSRGFALWYLWDAAIEAQRKQQWSDLEFDVGVITKLQPHYIAPWMFQSWNLAYNVSHELDAPGDKYRYVVRGFELLAEGHRHNRDNPDLRYEIGRFYQDKLGLADENIAYRTLFQLSCIRPVDSGVADLDERDDRDPHRLRPGGAVNLKRFERFCQKHPHLVRRMREGMKLRTPDDVIDFLAVHRDLPSYYPTRWSERPFPLLPRRGDTEIPLEFAAEDARLPDEFDNFTAARVWYEYAQEPLPPPAPMTMPGSVPYDPARYRKPRNISSLLFRQSPARAQTFIAERYRKEGWIDGGWEVDGATAGDKPWFPAKKVVVGDKRHWAAESWGRALPLWETHGRRNGLWLTADERQDLERRARAYREKVRVTEKDLDVRLRPEDVPEELRDSFVAHSQLYWHHDQRGRLANFDHFHAQARAEGTKKAIAARQLFDRARKTHQAAEDETARRFYDEAFDLWKQLLNEQDDFRADLAVQEECYKLQWEYLKLAPAGTRALNSAQVLQALTSFDVYPRQGIRPALVTLALPLAPERGAEVLGLPKLGPMDGLAKDGKPFIGDKARRQARQRLGLDEPAKP